MKLIVLAQTPPPLHGQSRMVQTMVESLPAHGIEVHHVNLRLSRSATDIGGWRLGKLPALLDACWHAIATRLRTGADILYYVPAPGKRGALYRDWLVMLLCRPFFRRLVLHFHNGGLADWLACHATGPERWVTGLLLGRADLAVVLGDALRPDAAALQARRTEVVTNGIADPGEPTRPARPAGSATEVLFLGLGDESKGLFDLAATVLEANRLAGGVNFRLTVAGPWPDAASARRFARLEQEHPGVIRHAGFASAEKLARLFAAADCLALPTRYSHEGQPLVVIEALAHDVPVIATRWRALPEMLDELCGRLVTPGEPKELAEALLALRRSPPAPGAARRRFLERFTAEHHLAALTSALTRLDG
jgi:glycosyltransferase involved in cell wall biosynthesis